MPLFYFDYDDGEDAGIVTDTVGSELSDVQAAVDEASRTIFALAVDAIRGSRMNRLSIIVRDVSGDIILKVWLDYRVETTP